MIRIFPRTFACLLATLTLCPVAATLRAQDKVPVRRDRIPTTTVSIGDLDTNGLVLLQNQDGRTERLDLGVVMDKAEPKVKAAWMGVGVDVPGDTVRSQLKLPDGTGLVVNWIDDAGPAKGLLRQHDVLLKLEDQLLVNGEQLITLVRLHKPGETIQMSIIRESRLLAVAIKLAEKEVYPLKSVLHVDTVQQSDLNTAYLQFEPTKIDNIIQWDKSMTLVPTTQPDRRTLIRRLTLDLAGVLPSDSEVESFVNDNSPDAYQKLVERLTTAAPKADPSAPRVLKYVRRLNTTQPTQNQSGLDYWLSDSVTLKGDVVVHAAHTGPVTIDDGEVLMWLQPAPDGSAELTALDRATGKNLFKGPIGTAEQWNAVPETVRQKFENWREAMQRASHAPATQPQK